MPQHEECNSCYEDFEKSELGQDCVGCLYYNHHCPGASHKRKDTGIVIDAQFNITALKLILSLGSPLTSPTRSRFFCNIAQTGGGQGELLCCSSAMLLLLFTLISLLLGQSGIPHILPLPYSGATRKLVISASISNKRTDASIDVQLHVDGGCEAFDLVLLPEDVEQLGLLSTGETGNGLQQDGSVLCLTEYERVAVELSHSDGSTEMASLFPFVQTGIETTTAVTIYDVPAETPVTRLLGYGGLTRFGLHTMMKF